MFQDFLLHCNSVVKKKFYGYKSVATRELKQTATASTTRSFCIFWRTRMTTEIFCIFIFSLNKFCDQFSLIKSRIARNFEGKISIPFFVRRCTWSRRRHCLRSLLTVIYHVLRQGPTEWDLGTKIIKLLRDFVPSVFSIAPGRREDKRPWERGCLKP